jgi:hypothetical protein
MSETRRQHKPTDRLLVSIAKNSSPEENKLKNGPKISKCIVLQEDVMVTFYRSKTSDLTSDNKSNIEVIYYLY